VEKEMDRSGDAWRAHAAPRFAPLVILQSEKAMTLTTKIVTLIVVAGLAAVPADANAFWGHHHRRVTTAYSIPTVPVVVARPVVAAAPIVVARPVFARAPVVVGYAPAVPAYPATTAAYVAPTTTYYAPTTTYYAPVPTTTYYAPSVAAPVVGVPVTTYYAPSPVVVPAPAIYVP
jgi:hypothetical protein